MLWMAAVTRIDVCCVADMCGENYVLRRVFRASQGFANALGKPGIRSVFPCCFKHILQNIILEYIL